MQPEKSVRLNFSSKFITVHEEFTRFTIFNSFIVLLRSTIELESVLQLYESRFQ